MEPTAVQKSALKKLMGDDGWEIVTTLVARYIAKLESQEINGQNEFETLRMLHVKQGKIAGLKDFFERLDSQAFE